ncbi:2OG-Fe dioxygenase family protein [Streptomyces sp. NPDC048442]|uniref:2OG-Fe dioxygenase family protein n=1 Tax=Streptomyces sp. NPDC048442 TaxID=3154823 RepID=UPI00341588CF
MNHVSAGGVREPQQPFVQLGPEVLTAALETVPVGAVKEFTDSWNDLPADEHLPTDVPYRFRRYGTFRLVGERWERLPHTAFFQGTNVNSVNGGVDRMFAPLDDSVATGPALHAVVTALRERLPGSGAGIDTCGVHQIRVTATAGAEGNPAPEGVHRDGHHYVGQVLIRREDVQGAESCLYDLQHRPIHTTVLTEPFAAIVLDDRRVLHGVTPFAPSPGTRVGVRDTLLVDFFPRTAP